LNTPGASTTNGQLLYNWSEYRTNLS
jgi:hypothetical protein